MVCQVAPIITLLTQSPLKKDKGLRKMMLKEKISEAVKASMRAKESERLTTLRFLQAAIKQKEVDERIELDDAQVTAIIEKQIKQRRESIAAFDKAGRVETANQERAEIVVLQTFLPEAAKEDEINAVITQAMAEVKAQGVEGPAAMGKIMAIVKTKLAGRAEMGAVSQRVKGLFS